MVSTMHPKRKYYRFLTSVISDDIPLHSHRIHLFVQLVALFPKIASGASRNSTVVDVDVRSNAFLFHAFHELEANISPRTFLHARHSRSEDDDILLNPHFCHFVKELETLTVLEASFF
jgi:hypothetical protein